MSLCLSMIVRNEAPVIRRCLESARPFIDAWLIVDTGSTDGTQDLVKAALRDKPGRLEARPWVNFARNRTEAFELCRDRADYALIIDADDCLEADPGFVMPPLTADGYYMELRHGSLAYYRPQIVKSALPWKFTGRVHEYLHCGAAKNLKYLPPALHMLMHHDGDRSRDGATALREAEALEQDLLEEPGNARYVFYLAQSYRDAGNLPAAIRNYYRRVAMGGWMEEVWWSLYQIPQLEERLGLPWPIVMEHYLDAHQVFPGRAEPMYQLGMHYQRQKKHAAAEVFLAKAVAAPSPRPDRLFVERPLYQYAAAMEYAVACYYIGRHDRAIAINRQLLDASLPASVADQITRNLGFSLDVVEKV